MNDDFFGGLSESEKILMKHLCAGGGVTVTMNEKKQSDLDHEAEMRRIDEDNKRRYREVDAQIQENYAMRWASLHNK